MCPEIKTHSSIEGGSKRPQRARQRGKDKHGNLENMNNTEHEKYIVYI